MLFANSIYVAASAALAYVNAPSVLHYNASLDFEIYLTNASYSTSTITGSTCTSKAPDGISAHSMGVTVVSTNGTLINI